MGLTCSVQRRSNEAPFVPGIATRYRRYVAIEHDCLLGTDRALPAPIRQRPAGHSIAGGRPVVETYPCVGRQWLHVIRTGTSLRPTVINSWIPWTPKASAVGPVRCHGVRSCHEIRRAGEGLRTEPTAAAQRYRRELIFMPLKRPSRPARELAQAPGLRTFASFKIRPPAPSRTTVKLGQASAALVLCTTAELSGNFHWAGGAGSQRSGGRVRCGGQKLWMGRAGERYLRCCLRDGFGLTFLAHFKKDGGHDAAPPGARIGREK